MQRRRRWNPVELAPPHALFAVASELTRKNLTEYDNYGDDDNKRRGTNKLSTIRSDSVPSVPLTELLVNVVAIVTNSCL